MIDIGPEPNPVVAKRILCISLTPIERDARVLRQVGLLAEIGQVTTVGFGEKPPGASEHFRVPDGLSTLPQTIHGVVKLVVRAHRSVECGSPAAQWVLEQQVDDDWDLVVANDARVLDLAARLAGNTPIWADLHEWAPEERTHILSWRILVAPFMVHLCRRYLKEAAMVTTVSKGIVDLYREKFGVGARLMTNAGPFRDIVIHEPEEGRVACVHSGAAINGRGLETMVKVFRDLPEQYSLDLYLVPGGDGGAHLRELKKLAGESARIRFHEPVLPGDLPITLSKYDLGIFWIPPTHTNARLTLPNKFYDYVQARIGMAIGPSEEMVRELRQYGLGLVSKTFEQSDLVGSLLSLTSRQLSGFKHAADLAASALSFEAQSAVIQNDLKALLAEA